MGRDVRAAMLAAAVSVTASLGSMGPAGAANVDLILGGDIQWASTGYDVGGIAVHPRPSSWERVLARVTGWQRERELALPYVFHDDQDLLAKIGVRPVRRARIQHPLTFADEAERLHHPFLKIAPVLHQADIAFANLEMPLSDRGRLGGLQRDGRDSVFRGPPSFAGVLAWAGIDVVSTANNHALDAGEEGLLDTRASLLAAGVQPVGTGRNLDEARRPAVIERHGVRIAFLAYSMVDQSRAGYALNTRSGMAPLDPFLVAEDIAAAAGHAHHTVISLHWGIDDQRSFPPSARRLARSLIEAGADVVVGHHPHLPAEVEAYNGGVIFYSLGNFIFGHYRAVWIDNVLAQVTLADGGVAGARIIPISGRGVELAQPAVLEGPPAVALLEDIAARSAGIGTAIAVAGTTGVVDLSTSRPSAAAGLGTPGLLAAILLALGLAAGGWRLRRYLLRRTVPHPPPA